MLCVRCRRPAIRPPAPSFKVPAPSFVLALASVPIAPLNNGFFQEFMRTYMERFQDQASVGKVRNKFDGPLKSRNPNLYYGYLHMECYYLCQQYKDYFEIIRSQGHKRVPFGIGFLKNHILNQWQRHMIRIQQNQLALLSWDKFKVFLRKNLGEFNVFVGQIWTKIKSNP